MSPNDTAPVAVVTGAGQGIGRGITLCLAEAGFDIVANDLRAEPTTETGLYEVKLRVEEIGRRCVPVQADIANRMGHARIIEAALDEFGAIDVLVNNAGVAPRVRTDMLDISMESFDRLMTINARGPFFLTQAVAKQMIKQVDSGRIPRPIIIFITSISADTSSPNRAEYCISKSAESMAARLFAHRMSEFGVNVYEIRPGIIETPMTQGVRERYDKLISGGLIPQNRWGTPEDVGKVAVALAKGYLGYSTGASIVVGGGMEIPRL